jgi:hypothetical protein
MIVGGNTSTHDLPQSSPVCLTDTARVGIRTGAPLPKPWGAPSANSDTPVATSARRQHEPLLRRSSSPYILPLHCLKQGLRHQDQALVSSVSPAAATGPAPCTA